MCKILQKKNFTYRQSAEQIGTLDKGGSMLLLFDQGGNYRVWLVAGSDAKPLKPDIMQNIIVKPSVDTTAVKTVGNFDPSKVVAMGIALTARRPQDTRLQQ